MRVTSCSLTNSSDRDPASRTLGRLPGVVESCQVRNRLFQAGSTRAKLDALACGIPVIVREVAEVSIVTYLAMLHGRQLIPGWDHGLAMASIHDSSIRHHVRGSPIGANSIIS